MSSEGSEKSSSCKAAVASLKETSQKVQAAVIPAIAAIENSKEFSKKDGLDFLDVKNSLLLSYLIELTVFVRNKNNGTSNEKNLHRLTEMKTVLDKTRGLDKKLRYQIEKLLAANTSATSYAAGGDNNGPEDPLQFRPDLGSFGKDDNDDSNSDESDDEDNEGSASGETAVAARSDLFRDNRDGSHLQPVARRTLHAGAQEPGLQVLAG